MTKSARWPDAALLGVAGSMRTLMPPAMLALRGRISGRGRYAAYALAAGELAQDKLPVALDRVGAPSLGARVASGALGGGALAGPAGALAGGASAAVSTFATFRARKLIGQATGISDPWIGAAEDVVAATAAAVATRPAPDGDVAGEEVPEPPLRAAARGLAAGVAGTATMTLAQAAYHQLTGAEPSDAPQKAARKILAAARKRVPRRHRSPLNHGMHWFYGVSWGIPYGVVVGTGARQPETSGVAFGLAVWSVGLAHLPALGLAPPPWKQSPRALATDAAFHVVYGLGAAGALRALAPHPRTPPGPR